ncbi:hypothetical protein Tco_1548286 [Tanacetum coccineum]
MVNVIPPDHVDDVRVVKPNQHDDVPVVLEPVLVDEDEDPEEEEFKEEEEPQEEEKDDMEVNIEEDENESELTYHYEEVDHLNPLSPIFDLEHEDVIKVEDLIESEDETVPTSVHECEARNGCNGKLVEKLGNAKEKAECEKLKKDLEEARMIKESVDAAIDAPKSVPLTQAAIRRMIKESVDAAIAAERAGHMNAGNDARGYGPVRGQDVAPVVRECTFAGFIKYNPTVFHGTEGAIKLRRWFEKTKSVFGISECAEGKKVKFGAATL